MEIKIVKKCVTATNSFKKVGEVVNVRGADAERLVKDGNAEYTADSKKQMEASKKVLDARAKAKADAEAKAAEIVEEKTEEELAKLEEAKETLGKLNELKNEEDAELELWHAGIDEVERKVEFIDKALFEPSAL